VVRVGATPDLKLEGRRVAIDAVPAPATERWQLRISTLEGVTVPGVELRVEVETTSVVGWEGDWTCGGPQAGLLRCSLAELSGSASVTVRVPPGAALGARISLHGNPAGDPDPSNDRWQRSAN
jgi:hypothetical protein